MPTPEHTWSDVLGNNASALEILQLAYRSGGLADLSAWIERQARDLYGDGPDSMDLDWRDLAAQLYRDAEPCSVCLACGAVIALNSDGWRESEFGDVCAACIADAEADDDAIAEAEL
jgi:hypothetical protein